MYSINRYWGFFLIDNQVQCIESLYYASFPFFICFEFHDKCWYPSSILALASPIVYLFVQLSCELSALLFGVHELSSQELYDQSFITIYHAGSDGIARHFVNYKRISCFAKCEGIMDVFSALSSIDNLSSLTDLISVIVL